MLATLAVDDLADIAFGPAPGTVAPAATSPYDRWLRAVALGGQGRYAAARAELAALRRARAGAVLESLAASTEASLLRQLGWHRLASGHDGRALAVLGDSQTTSARIARCDALTGLAADALGCGRLDLGFRLLERCDDHLVDAGPELWRQRIRLHWVTAEMTLAAGDPVRGRENAARAVELADASRSVRHQVKSELLLAAATSAGPDPAAAAGPAREVLARCDEHNLRPLRWAASMLLGGVAPAVEVEQVRLETEAAILAAGGRFREW
ncbi:hypothetical protein [Rhodococcus gannanensis]|uniref:DNA-binding protein n=1 Tax=Rhodococcus gannanensis TaxID=1960308 RepID=A0ABW4NZX7_9NOCA